MTTDVGILHAQWSARPNVKAFTTLRAGGVSKGKYASLNLGAHVGDDPKNVIENRKRLFEQCDLPGEPKWLKQVHGTRIIIADDAQNEEADGAVTRTPGVVCAIMTADCLPIFLCNKQGSEVGLLHAGWRGLADGIVEAGVNAMQSDPKDIHAWLGPAIGFNVFEVGSEVRERLTIGLSNEDACFKPSTIKSPTNPGKYFADLYALATLRLQQLGLSSITVANACTFEESKKYFSYRRDGQCGRMASLIWID